MQIEFQSASVGRQGSFSDQFTPCHLAGSTCVFPFVLYSPSFPLLGNFSSLSPEDRGEAIPP